MKLTLYHGTNCAFDTFDSRKPYYWFTDNKEFARLYAEEAAGFGGEPTILTVRFNGKLEKISGLQPITSDMWGALRERGFDGYQTIQAGKNVYAIDGTRVNIMELA